MLMRKRIILADFQTLLQVIVMPQSKRSKLGIHYKPPGYAALTNLHSLLDESRQKNEGAKRCFDEGG